MAGREKIYTVLTPYVDEEDGKQTPRLRHFRRKKDAEKYVRFVKRLERRFAVGSQVTHPEDRPVAELISGEIEEDFDPTPFDRALDEGKRQADRIVEDIQRKIRDEEERGDKTDPDS